MITTRSVKRFLARHRRYHTEDNGVDINRVLIDLRACQTRKAVMPILQAAGYVPLWNRASAAINWDHESIPPIIKDYLQRWERTYEVRSSAVSKILHSKGWQHIEGRQWRPPLTLSNRQAKRTLHRAIKNVDAEATMKRVLSEYARYDATATHHAMIDGIIDFNNAL